MKVALAQINPLLGNIPFNEQKIRTYIQRAYQQKASLLVFPELALNGYPPLDLLKYNFFLKETNRALKNIHKETPKGMAVLVGAVGAGHSVTNAVFLLQKNKPAKMFSKEYLADYNVFDEKRYFSKGRLRDNFFVFQGQRVQILICEEIWQEPEILLPCQQKPDLILSLNASPFDLSKAKKRLQTTGEWVKKYQCPLVYVNMVGGQEELIFDGASFVLDKGGQVGHQSPLFQEDLHVVDLPLMTQHKAIHSPENQFGLEKMTMALEFGLREFVIKNGFESVHIGLSGGVDSAITATLACQALGSKNVRLFFLPGPFTSSLSQKGAYQMAKKLNCPLVVQSVENFYDHFLQNLDPPSLKELKPPSQSTSQRGIKSNQTGFEKGGAFKAFSSYRGTQKHEIHALGLDRGSNKISINLSDITKQNVQARLRSLFLMAYANQNPTSLLLGTANKSELALGYGTLYGDLTGGLLPLGDLFKTEVFALAQYLKIPAFMRNRPPSAELSRNQKDEDDLPPYKILDPVLKKLIEDREDPKTSFEKQIFQRMIKNQFKRKQSPPILKIKNNSFDRGWRWPFFPCPYKSLQKKV